MISPRFISEIEANNFLKDEHECLKNMLKNFFIINNNFVKKI